MMATHSIRGRANLNTVITGHILKNKVTLSQAWEGNTDCLHCAIRSSVLFNGLTEKDFEMIHEPVGQITLEPGSVIYKEGDGGHYLYTIRSGLVKLVQHLPGGGQRIVRLAGDTDVLGLEILVARNYTHEAVVLHTAELCRYPKDAVNLLSQHNPVLHKDLMTRWHKALADADEAITKLSAGPAKARVANLLLGLADKNTGRCVLFGRDDVGSLLNLTVETASRVIAEFKRQGLIRQLSQNHFELDILALQAVVDSKTQKAKG